MNDERRLHRGTTHPGTRAAEGSAGDVTVTFLEQSWQRSREAGVDPDGSNPPRLQFVEDLDLRRRLVQCASPVLDRLQDELTGLPLSVALTDEHARVMLRRDNNPTLGAALDNVYFAPGYSYSEEVIGTNGVGTALETGMAVYVHGRDHFHEAIYDFTCAGAPIHNPILGRVEGLIDITGRAREANPLMRQLALGAARDIESALLATGSEKQQLVLDAFLSACRRRRIAVYSLSCGVFMSNSIGARLLDPVDEAFLREEAHSLLAPSRLSQLDVHLPSGSTITVRRTIVEGDGETAGVVLEVDRAPDTVLQPVRRRSTASLPGSIGASPQWTRCGTEVMELASSDSNTILRGEAGCGKLTLARAAHLRKNPQALMAVVECSNVARLDMQVVDAFDSDATTIVLRDIEQLDAKHDRAVANVVERSQRNYPARWIVGTATTTTVERLSNSALARQFSTTTDIPALRHHPDDIPAIIRMQLEQLAPHRCADIREDALHILKKYHWPGNIAELIDALKYALRAQPVGAIAATDLPPSLSSSPRRTMTTMEGAERDIIVAVLRDCGGNRVRAAKSLGISRSSLYRKIDSFGIHL